MKKFDSHKWIKDFKLNNLLLEADVFATEEPPADAGQEDPKANRAVQKFELLIKEKAPWDKVRQLVPDLPDMKQVDFAMYLLADLKVGEKALKKLKLKL